MKESTDKERFQTNSEWVSKVEGMTLFSANSIAKCFDLIVKTNNTLATQANLTSEIFKTLASLKVTIEGLKTDIEIIRDSLISFDGETEH